MWDHAAYEALAKRSFGAPAIVVDSVIDGIIAFETDYAGQAIASRMMFMTSICRPIGSVTPRSCAV